MTYGYRSYLHASGPVRDAGQHERPDDEGGTAAVDVPDSLGIVSQLENGATAVYHISSVASHGRGGAIEIEASFVRDESVSQIESLPDSAKDLIVAAVDRLDALADQGRNHVR